MLLNTKCHIFVVSRNKTNYLFIKKYLEEQYKMIYFFFSYRELISSLKIKEIQKNINFLLVSDIPIRSHHIVAIFKDIRSFIPHIKILILFKKHYQRLIRYFFLSQLDFLVKKDIKSIQTILYKIKSGSFFGIHHYFNNLTTPFTKNKFNLIDNQLNELTITSSKQRLKYVQKISYYLEKSTTISSVLSFLLLDEMTSNAVLHPSSPTTKLSIPNKKKKQLYLGYQGNIKFTEKRYVTLRYGIIDNHLIFSCIDYMGTLTKQQILYYLHRHTSINQTSGLPHGTFDNHGRGIFLMRENLSHLVFNIIPNKKTEVIGILNLKEKKPSKQLSIFI